MKNGAGRGQRWSWREGLWLYREQVEGDIGARRVGIWGTSRECRANVDPAAPPGKSRKPVQQEQSEHGRQVGERLGRREPE